MEKRKTIIFSVCMGLILYQITAAAANEYANLEDQKVDAAIKALETQLEAKEAKERQMTAEAALKAAETQQYNSDAQYRRDMVITERISIIVLAVMSIFSLFYVLRIMAQKQHQPSDLLLAAGLISIVYGTIILVLVVESLEQLTASTGILGAIAGYLFGSARDKRNVPENEPKATKNSGKGVSSDS
jgi:hypothetical protein